MYIQVNDGICPVSEIFLVCGPHGFLFFAVDVMCIGRQDGPCWRLARCLGGRSVPLA
jgi:hypothetical protein